jgi:hypothetical protein
MEDLNSLLFNHNIFGDHWNHISTSVRNGNFVSILDDCADKIAEEAQLNSLSENQLQEYLSQCEDLLKEIMTSEMENDIKEFLIVRLEEICIAIRRYSTGGSERLQATIESNIGGILLRISTIVRKIELALVLKTYFLGY